MKSFILIVAIIVSVSIVTGCMEKLSIFQFKNVDGPILLPCPTQSNINQYEPYYQEQVPRGSTETQCTCITKSTLPQSNTCYCPPQCVETECTCVTKPSAPVSKCSALTLVPLKQAQIVDTDCTCCARQSNVPVCQCSNGNVPSCQYSNGNVPVCQCSNGNVPSCQYSNRNVPVCQCSTGNVPSCQYSNGNVPVCQCSTGNCVPKRTEADCACTCTPVSQNSGNCFPQCYNYVSPQLSTGPRQEYGPYNLDYSFPTTSIPQQYYGSLNLPYAYNSGYFK